MWWQRTLKVYARQIVELWIPLELRHAVDSVAYAKSERRLR